MVADVETSGKTMRSSNELLDESYITVMINQGETTAELICSNASTPLNLAANVRGVSMTARYAGQRTAESGSTRSCQRESRGSLRMTMRDAPSFMLVSRIPVQRKPWNPRA